RDSCRAPTSCSARTTEKGATSSHRERCSSPCGTCSDHAHFDHGGAMTHRHTTPALVALLISLAFASSAAAQNTIAIQGGTLIDGTGKAPVANAVVVIEGNKIAAVGDAGSVRVPAGARVINAAGKYVIPGLMDANVHLILNSSIEFMARYEG